MDQLALGLELARTALDFGSLCDPEEAAVAHALEWGRAGARQVPDIAAAAGVPERRVQDVIQHLLFEHQWPIGTAMAPPFGNYLIDNPDELEQTVELLRRRGISNLARAAALKRMPLRRFLEAVQCQIELERAG